MPKKITLRFADADTAELDRAATAIAGPDGREFIGPMAVIRRALAAFNAQHRPGIGEEHSA